MFGRGLHGWLFLIQTLIWVFLLLSAIAIFQMYTMSNLSPNYLRVHTSTIARKITSVSLGVIYQSHPMCEMVPMELNSIRVQCDGRLEVQKIIDFGIQPWDSSNCMNARGDDGNILNA